MSFSFTPGLASLHGLLKRAAAVVLSSAALMASTVSHASMAEFDLCNYWTDVPDRITFKRATNPFLGLSETTRTERNHSGVTTSYFKNQEGNVAGGPLHARNCTWSSGSYPGNSKMILLFKFKGTNFFGKPSGAAGVGDHLAVLAKGFVNRAPGTGAYQIGRGFAIYPPIGAGNPAVSRGAYVENFGYQTFPTNNMSLVIEDDKWYRVEMWVWPSSIDYTIYDEAAYPNVYMNGTRSDPNPALYEDGYGFAVICSADPSCENVLNFELEIKDIAYGFGY